MPKKSATTKYSRRTANTPSRWERNWLPPALEAIKGQRTVSEIASEFGVHPNLIAKWKKQALDELPGVFSGKKERVEQKSRELESELYRQIGQLKVELDWLKKNLDIEIEEKRSRIDPEHRLIPIYRQCELLGLARSSLYYRPVGISQLDLELMRLIDEQYTRTPFYGTHRMRAYLKGRGYRVNRKRIVRLMHLMGLIRYGRVTSHTSGCTKALSI